MQVSAENGGAPSSSSTAVHASAYWSVRADGGRPRSSSGAVYGSDASMLAGGRPTVSATVWATPKSISTAREKSCETRILDGLTSQCTMPRRWM